MAAHAHRLPDGHSVRLASVSVNEYLALRNYFVTAVRWAHTIDAAARTPESERLLARVDAFVALADDSLGADRGATLEQILAARQAGVTHCEVVVHGPKMLDVTNALVGFLHDIEGLRNIRPHVAPPPPAGIRAFLLACRTQLEAVLIGPAAAA